MSSSSWIPNGVQGERILEAHRNLHQDASTVLPFVYITQPQEVGPPGVFCAVCIVLLQWGLVLLVVKYTASQLGASYQEVNLEIIIAGVASSL